jgi:hypothetical protein
MSDKIKITKEDILSDNVELPEGYKFEKYKTKQEIKDEIQAQIDELESGLGEKPKDKELIEHGIMNHPYYQTLVFIEELKEELKNI